jgi:L-lactate dehydrogenase complex protein LldG
MGAREQILARVRAQLASRPPVPRPGEDERRAVIPARAAREGVDLVELFMARSRRVGASVGRVDDLAAVPAEVARFAREAIEAAAGAEAGGDTADLVAAVSPASGLSALPWASAGIVAAPHPPGPHHRVSVTAAWAGIAETGTCVVRSGAENAHSASILAPFNAVVLDAGAVLPTMEDVFARVRAEGVPRTILFVTGPSATGDIDLRVIVPAQGPRRVHVVLVGPGLSDRP